MSNHCFDVDIATEYNSIEVALMVWHFQFWIRKNRAMGVNFIEGRTWTYQTYKEIIACFPYWSYHQVKRILKKCFTLGILTKANFNEDKDDKTLWYAFCDEEKFSISKVSTREDLKDEPSGIGRNRPTDRAKSPYRSGEIARSYKDRDTLKDTLKDKDISSLPFGNFALNFWSKLKESNPKIKKPNLAAWTKEFVLLSKDGNGNTCEEIQKVIDYVISTRTKPSSNGFCWANVIQSPASMRKNFAKIWAEMTTPSGAQKGDEKADKALAEKVWNKCKGRKEQDIEMGYKYIEFKNGMTVEHLEFGSKDFRTKVLEQLSKRNIRLENL